MQLFFLEKPKEKIILNAEESKHAIKVLRKKNGDILNFTDGKGSLYKAKIINADSRKCNLEIISHETQEKKHNYYLHIAISPTKNIDRFKFFLEKVTEIGIDEITPIICKHSERKIIKKEKCNKTLLSAMKQSIKYYLPKFNDPISLIDFLKTEIEAKKYIAHCKNDNKKEFIKEPIGKKILILIGPEGDFSQDEIKKATQNNFKSISLGNSRLRTETAGIIAATICNIK